jgi:FlaA1/EpsC-like NDP-sugar epimerase
MKGWVKRIDILPRWIIVIIDICLLLFSVILGYLLRFNFNLSDIEKFGYQGGLLLFVGSGLLATLITRNYKGIIRYTGFQDAIRLFFTVSIAIAIVSILNYSVGLSTGKNLIPFSVAVISFMASFILLINYRVLVKVLFSYYKNVGKKYRNTLIYGAGKTGQISRHALETDGDSRFKVVAYVEDDYSKIGKSLNGIPIIAFKQFEANLMRLKIKEVVIAIENLDTTRTNVVVDKCLHYGVTVRNIPPVHRWMNGNLSVNQIREVKIEDLLGRESIKLDNYYVQQELNNKTVLITGAAGSIGRELVRQVVLYKPRIIIMIDQWETGLFEIENEINNQGKGSILITKVLDVTNSNRLEETFKEFSPEIVYHAAAYKHVPLMEENPSEAVHCNIGGTRITADLSVKYHVEKFVMVSTDKAVNPTSVMGASKRIAEMYVQGLNGVEVGTENIKTKFITTRFGNVLGSNGSVIPVFEDQIAKGGPITVTHPEITRFFMTIPEACQLVLEAGAMGKGGEVFIFDMGTSVKIVDLAKKMINLSGYKEGEDIEIVFTGLREGEKLHEELLSDKENNTPTHHHKIMIAEVEEVTFFKIQRQVERLLTLSAKDNGYEGVEVMKEIVPEFISNHSRYEKIDKRRAKTIPMNLKF